MNELTKELMCVQLRSGILLWLEQERCVSFMMALENPNCPKFVRIDDQMINTADISGIFNAKSMEDMTRRKNGQWQCKKGEWHDRSTTCDCSAMEYTEDQKRCFEQFGYYPTN